MIHLKTAGELQAMRRAGEAVALALKAMREAIVAGETSTLDLDEIAGEVLKGRGAKPVLNGYKPSFSDVPYMNNTCISLNNEVIHGVPKAGRILRVGDVISLDLAASVDGWCADSAITVPVGEVSVKAKRLLQVTREALQIGVAQARRGNSMGDIGSAVQKYVERNRMSVVRDMVGHGIGQTPHEAGLDVPNWGKAGTGIRLKPGMTFCVEPMVTLGKHGVGHPKNDVWTIVTDDGSWAAHFEHTIAITEDGPPLILTALPRSAVEATETVTTRAGELAGAR